MRNTFFGILLLLAIVLAIASQVAAEPMVGSQQCSVSASGDWFSSSDWTPQEKFVWTSARQGMVADLNSAGNELDPKKTDKWPDDRILRPEFLETILLNEKYRSCLTRKGVRIVGARFTKSIDFENAELRHDLWLAKSLIEKSINFDGLNSTRSIAIDGSKVSGTVRMEGAHISGWLSMKGADLRNVSLVGARLFQLALGSSTILGKLDLNSVMIEGILEASYSSLETSDRYLEFIDLTRARIGGQVVFTGATVEGRIVAFGIEAGDVVLDSGKFDEVDLRFSKIKGLLVLWGSTVSGSLDLSGAEIEGSLLLGSGPNATKWSDGKSTLKLSDAMVGTIPKLTDGWAPTLEMEGFTYKGLEAFDGAAAETWLNRSKSFAMQPYEQLALTILNQGRTEEATAIRFTGRERERRTSSWWRWIWLTSLDWLIGYGYYPARAIGWAAGFVILGAIILRLSGQGLSNGMPFGLAYSFDLLLPIIKLREMHYKIDLQGWARYYFYAHKITGFLLASFLIAGIAGLTK
jgi:uncharacterized protein YjbI with pentapeptide repeats